MILVLEEIFLFRVEHFQSHVLIIKNILSFTYILEE